MKKEIKSVIIFPPGACPVSPYLSLPLLVGQLIKAGYDSKCLDLNAEFFNYIFSSDFISKNIDKKEIEKKNLLKEVETAVKTYKSNDFFEPKNFFRAMKVLSYVLELYSKKYNCDLSFSDLKVKGYDYSYKSLFECSKSFNLFDDFFKEEIKKIKDIDFVGVSVCYASQLLPAFIFMRLVKKYTKAKVALGGNLMTRNPEVFSENLEFFDVFADFVLTGDGEVSIVKLLDALKNEKILDNVSGLIYKQNGKVVTNKIEKIKNLSEVAVPNCTGLDFSKYFIPETIFPIQISRGCYWGKCSFCDIRNDKKYFIIKTPKQVVDEIVEIKEKYGISSFEFTDESLPPEYHSCLADELITRKVDINFYCMVRLEKKFTKELLSKMQKAGAKMLSWGYEAGSPRVLSLMNKGIDSRARYRILKDSASLGIWNHIFIMFGFPTETFKESLYTAKSVAKHKDIIDSYITMDFILRKHCDVTAKNKTYEIENIDKKSNLLSDYDFSFQDISHKKRSNYYAKLRKKYLYSDSLPLWQITLPDEYLFLRVLKSSRETIKNIHLK